MYKSDDEKRDKDMMREKQKLRIARSKKKRDKEMESRALLNEWIELLGIDKALRSHVRGHKSTWRGGHGF